MKIKYELRAASMPHLPYATSNLSGLLSTLFGLLNWGRPNLAGLSPIQVLFFECIQKPQKALWLFLSSMQYIYFLLLQKHKLNC